MSGPIVSTSQSSAGRSCRTARGERARARTPASRGGWRWGSAPRRARVAPDRPDDGGEIRRERDRDAARDAVGGRGSHVGQDEWVGDAHASAVLHSRTQSVSQATHPIVRTVVSTVTSRGDLRRFVDLPWQLFDRRRHPQWVPPLRATVYDALDRKKHPFYDQADRELFLARTGRSRRRAHRRDRESRAQRLSRRSRRLLGLLRVHRRSGSRRRAVRRGSRMAGRVAASTSCAAR